MIFLFTYWKKVNDHHQATLLFTFGTAFIVLSYSSTMMSVLTGRLFQSCNSPQAVVKGLLNIFIAISPNEINQMDKSSS